MSTTEAKAGNLIVTHNLSPLTIDYSGWLDWGIQKGDEVDAKICEFVRKRTDFCHEVVCMRPQLHSSWWKQTKRVLYARIIDLGNEGSSDSCWIKRFSKLPWAKRVKLTADYEFACECFRKYPPFTDKVQEMSWAEVSRLTQILEYLEKDSGSWYKKNPHTWSLAPESYGFGLEGSTDEWFHGRIVELINNLKSCKENYELVKANPSNRWSQKDLDKSIRKYKGEASVTAMTLDELLNRLLSDTMDFQAWCTHDAKYNKVNDVVLVQLGSKPLSDGKEPVDHKQGVLTHPAGTLPVLPLSTPGVSKDDLFEKTKEPEAAGVAAPVPTVLPAALSPPLGSTLSSSGVLVTGTLDTNKDTAPVPTVTFSPLPDSPPFIVKASATSPKMDEGHKADGSPAASGLKVASPLNTPAAAGFVPPAEVLSPTSGPNLSFAVLSATGPNVGDTQAAATGSPTPVSTLGAVDVAAALATTAAPMVASLAVPPVSTPTDAAKAASSGVDDREKVKPLVAAPEPGIVIIPEAAMSAEAAPLATPLNSSSAPSPSVAAAPSKVVDDGKEAEAGAAAPAVRSRPRFSSSLRGIGEFEVSNKVSPRRLAEVLAKLPKKANATGSRF